MAKISPPATAIILAGGKSSRMDGQDKSLLPVAGKTLIRHIIGQLEPHFSEIIIGANETEKYGFLKLPLVPDIEKDKGPLGGIHACLLASSNYINFITACDIPLMNIELIKNMIILAADADIVMPVTKDQKYEPLFAVYKKSAIAPIEEILKNNGRRVIELLKYLKCRTVEIDGDNWYKNLNSEEDYRNFIDDVTIR
jgi:molybdopterin-guanine dinucleotide biosynthesis protein A